MPDNNSTQESFANSVMGGVGNAVGNAATGLLGGLTGMLFEHHNDQRQLRQQQALQNMQIQGQEQLTDYNTQKQLQMWKDTSYPAQMEQLQKAGLNPGLLYGQGGGGGQTAQIAQGSVGAGEAPKGGGEAMGMAMQMQNLQLIDAQKRNIDADTKLKQSQIPGNLKEPGLKEAQTQSLLQGINNQKAQEELTKVQTSLATIQEDIAGKTENDAVGLIRAEMAKQQAVLNSLEAQKAIDVATYQDKIKIIHTEMIGALLNNQAIKKGLNKTDQEIQQMKTAMIAITTQANAATEQAAAATKNAETQSKLADFERSFGKQAGTILNSILGAASKYR